MTKRRYIVPTIAVGFLAVFAMQNTYYKPEKISSYHTVSASSAPTVKNLEPKIKSETIANQENIKSTLPFKTSMPTFDLKDLKKVNTYATKENVNQGASQNDNSIYRLITNYQSSSGQTLMIIQGTLPKGIDTFAEISNIENKTGTTKIKGVGATICESNGGYTQITFINDNIFYNIVGYKLDKEYLIKIANSLQLEQ